MGISRKMQLAELLLDSETKSMVLDDCVAQINAEVASKRGLSGLVIKAGYNWVKRLDNGIMVEKSMGLMIDDLVKELSVFHRKYLDNGGYSFDNRALADYFKAYEEDISSALLNVPDRKAQVGANKILKGIYKLLRPIARAEVKAALPGIASLISKYSIMKEVAPP